MSITIYVEGGGDSKELRARCRAGFSEFCRKIGIKAMPRIVASGSRQDAYDDFLTKLKTSKGDIVLLWVDSEDPMKDIEKTWDHLNARDGWKKPSGATDESALMMVTCMESWLVSDRPTLEAFFKKDLQASGLPSVVDLEGRERHAIQDALAHASRNCGNPYQKGKRSFELLGNIRPYHIATHCPSAERCIRLLKQHCDA